MGRALRRRQRLTRPHVAVQRKAVIASRASVCSPSIASTDARTVLSVALLAGLLLAPPPVRNG